MQPSPYTPGEIARLVPGRTIPLGQIEERLMYLGDLQRLVGRIRVDVGPRGVGKTSLLHEASLIAERRGVLAVWVTAGEQVGLVAAIAREIDRLTGEWSGDSALRGRLKEATIGIHVGVPGVAGVEASWGTPGETTDGPPAGTRDFEGLIVTACDIARENGKRGLALFIDEIQDADPSSLKLLGYGWQDFQRERNDLPVAVFAAGLPNSKQAINAAVSPSERFAFKTLGDLSDDAAAIALVRAARDLGVTWESDALDAAVRHANGYPHTVQLVGQYAWEAAGLPDPGGSITNAHVSEAIIATQEDLRELYDSRLSRIRSQAERDFVRAMASLGDGPISRKAIAAALGKPTTSISTARQALINSGMIQEAGRGELRFTIDGFAAYVRAQFEG